MSTIYKYPGEVTPQEFIAVAAVFSHGQRMRSDAATMLRIFYQYAPARLEHEINRQRGFAFDSGEAGFSHSSDRKRAES